MLIQKLSLLFFLLKKKKKEKTKQTHCREAPLPSSKGGGCERQLGNQVQGVGTDYLATLNTAQPDRVGGKGDCEEPHFHDNQLPTPYSGGKKEEGPDISLEAFPLKTSSSG